MKEVHNQIEILPVTLLDENRRVVEDLKRLATAMKIGLGWHYLLDWAWITSRLNEPAGQKIVDAGAGEGLLQWWLAEQGATVMSVDRGSRAELSLRYRLRYRVRGLRTGDLAPAHQVVSRNLRGAMGPVQKALAAARGGAALLMLNLPRSAPGEVIIYNQDLVDLAQVPTGSQDAVVAVSALEHNSPAGLEQVVQELLRVLKPGGRLLATLGAAKTQDWFHEPSKGWNYTEETLRRIFRLPAGTPSNYAQFDELFQELKNCAELRDNLASFYFKSGDNGMPWGQWDPQYLPVGVCKIKA